MLEQVADTLEQEQEQALEEGGAGWYGCGHTPCDFGVHFGDLGVLGVYLFGDLPLGARATSPLSDTEMGIAEERMARGTRAMSFILKLMANSFFYN
jgi:hypothetical protein